LLIELKRFGLNQLVVQTFAHWLDDVTLFISRVLLSLLAWTLELLFELEFVLQLIVHMLNKPFCG
jgi:hypothetical protein